MQLMYTIGSKALWRHGARDGDISDSVYQISEGAVRYMYVRLKYKRCNSVIQKILLNLKTALLWHA